VLAPYANLRSMTFLVVDADVFYRSIVRGMLMGFGAGAVVETGSAIEGSTLLATAKIDALILDQNVRDVEIFEYIKSLRMDKFHPRRSIPILLSMSTVMLSSVNQARGCGSHIVLRKPFSPQILYDRLAWISSSKRPYWESDAYYGPDRRVRALGRIGGKRRKTDVSQDEIDALFQFGGEHDQEVAHAS